MSKIINFNDDWLFYKNYENMKETELAGDGDLPEIVQIPHTVNQSPFNYFSADDYQMISGYRREFDFQDDWEGKRVFINFGAVAHHAMVYLNGELIATHSNGYTAFTAELTDKLVKGNNVLDVRVDSHESLNQPPFGYLIDYMTYGGIYREVSLKVTEKEYIEDAYVISKVPQHALLPGHIKDGRMMKDKIPGFIYEGEAETEIEINMPDGFGDHEFGIRQRIYDYTNDALAEVLKNEDTDDCFGLSEVAYKFTDLNKDNFVDGKVKISSEVDHVSLWDVSYPKLYLVVTELIKDGKVIDMHTCTTGFKVSEFNSKGYYLNGRKLKIRGLNRHQSFPYVGYAMPDSIQEQDALILKNELGVNAVRTSHYPQSHAFIKKCDELGILVFTEIPGWQNIGDEEWKKIAVDNVAEMVKQYRNHTSIILWGVRINESQDDDELYAKTNKLAHSLDSTRPTGGVRYLKKSSLLEDVYTYNDFVHTGDNQGCDKKSDVSSNVRMPYLITEYNGHMFPTKPDDDEAHRIEHALRHANVLNCVASQKDIAGSFAWCMFDYNTHKEFGAGDGICYHGVTDMFRNPKAAAYVYKSQQGNEPVLYVPSALDLGDYPARYLESTYVFTNADSVKVYESENGDNYNSVGEFKRDGRWQFLRFAPIEIKLDFIKDGTKKSIYKFEAVMNDKVVKTVYRGATTKVSLECKVSSKNLHERKTYDAASVRITAVDQFGNVLNYFNEPVVLETKGAIEIIGPKVISLKGGMGGTYVKTVGVTGRGVLKIKNAQAEEISIEFNCQK